MLVAKINLLYVDQLLLIKRKRFAFGIWKYVHEAFIVQN